MASLPIAGIKGINISPLNGNNFGDDQPINL